jgi:hypothetical protein
MQEQLAGTFPSAQPDLAGVILNRSRRTFTPRDRLVLNLLRFHISEACRTAKLMEADPVVAVAQAFAPLVEGGTVVLDRDGAVLYASAEAQKHLEAFFAAEKPFRGGLPASLRQWTHRELAAFGAETLAARPLRALTVSRGEDRLEMRLSSAPGGAAHVLLLRAEGPAYELEKLGALGLGPRATEALYWATQGKTNEEIGIILGMATATVKTHLKSIFTRLGMVKNAQRSKTVKVDLDHARLWVRHLKRGLGVDHPLTGSLANHGYGLRLIQDYLGHRDLKHTVHYTRVAAGRFEGLWR